MSSNEYTAKDGTRFETIDSNCVALQAPGDIRRIQHRISDLIEFVRSVEEQEKKQEHRQCSVCEGLPHHWREFAGWKMCALRSHSGRDTR